MAGILDELIYLVKVNYAGGSQFNKLNRDVNRTSKAMKVMKVNMMGGLGLGGLFGGLSAGLAIKGLIEAAKHADMVRTRFQLTTNSVEETNKMMALSLGMAKKYGINLKATEKSFSGFLASTMGGGMSIQQATQTFDNFAASIAGARLPADQAEGALYALQQMISKGKIQAQELRLQLGEKVPLAVKTFADVYFKNLAPDKRMGALDDALKGGKLGIDKLLEVSVLLRSRLGKNVENSADSVIASMERMNSSFEIFKRNITDAGFGITLAKLAKKLEMLFGSKSFQQFGIMIGKTSKLLIPMLDFTFKVLKIVAKSIDFIFNKMRWFLSSAILTTIIMFAERVLLQVGLLKLGLTYGIIPAIIKMIPAIRLIVTQVGILYAKTLLWIMAARAILLVTEELELIFHAMAGEDLSHYNVTFKEMRTIAYQIADAIKQLAQYAKQFADEMKRGAEIEQMKAHPFATALQVGKNVYKQGVLGNMLPTSVGMGAGMATGLATSIYVSNQLYTNSDSAAYNLGKGSIDGANGLASKKTTAKTNQ